MASLPRYALIANGSTFHVTWQCHNKTFLMKEDWAKEIYYRLLLKYKDRYKVKIYSYCFMSSHPHITGYCQEKELFSDFFRIVNSIFAKSINKKLERKGQVVMDRFKSPVIHTDVHLLKVMSYIDLNPKRANIAPHPKDYKWSSFHYYAYGKSDPLLTPAPSYLGLGKTPEARRRVYLNMIENILKNDWKKKKPYSSSPFIGNPEWVINKERELKITRTQRFKDWRERFEEKFCVNST